MKTIEWVNGKDTDFFSSGLMTLKHRWSLCPTLKGNYIEGEEVDFNKKYVGWLPIGLTLYDYKTIVIILYYKSFM